MLVEFDGDGFKLLDASVPALIVLSEVEDGLNGEDVSEGVGDGSM